MLNNYLNISSAFHREKQLKLDKIRATQAYIEEFKKEQAIWRRRKQEEMEEENRKIMEFASMQQQREEDRMAKVRDTEERKQRLQSMVSKPETVDKILYVFVFRLEIFPLCNRLPSIWKENNRSVMSWNKSARSCIWRSKRRQKGRRRW